MDHIPEMALFQVKTDSRCAIQEVIYSFVSTRLYLAQPKWEREIPRDHQSSQSASTVTLTLATLPVDQLLMWNSSFLSVPSSEVGYFGWVGLLHSGLTRKSEVLRLSAGQNFLREILILTLRKSVCLCRGKRQKPWERIAFPVHSVAGVCTDRQCPMAVGSEYCSLLLKIARGFGGGGITEEENSTELVCNYTKVIGLPQQGGLGVTESPEYLI